MQSEKNNATPKETARDTGRSPPRVFSAYKFCTVVFLCPFLRKGFKEDDTELKDTVKGMMSDDCKERMAAEYHQTKIRYEKLKKLNTRISRQK